MPTWVHGRGVSAYLLGAEQVIALDRRANPLEMARNFGKALVLNHEKNDVLTLRELTGGCGPDACIAAVGLDAAVKENRRIGRKGKGLHESR